MRSQGDTEKRLPEWLRIRRDSKKLREVKVRLRKTSVSTVCEEARCPNITECFSRPAAAFLILGDVCTRSCRYCSVKKGIPGPPDVSEPYRIARAASDLELKHIVITSVTRDDLADKGARHFYETIIETGKQNPGSDIEVLTPDFSGRKDLVELVLGAGPEVFNHNIETIGRLQGLIRPGASLERSLDIIRWAQEISGKSLVKSGFMVGMGETEDEILDLLHSLKQAGCDIVTIGQYMRPSKAQIPVNHYWHPDHFSKWSEYGLSIGIDHVFSAPLVRSSYNAQHSFHGVITRRSCKNGRSSAKIALSDNDNKKHNTSVRS